jgi:hypothetical protein
MLNESFKLSNSWVEDVQYLYCIALYCALFIQHVLKTCCMP